MYCKKCGKTLINKEINNEGQVPYCSTCDELYFPKSNLAIMVVLTNDKNEVCLLKQNHVNNDYVLIAGYHSPGESLEATATRETKEEVGLEIFNLKYIESFYYDKKDIVMVAYHGECQDSQLKIQESEVQEAVWVNIDKALKLIRQGSIGSKVLNKYLQQLSINN